MGSDVYKRQQFPRPRAALPWVLALLVDVQRASMTMSRSDRERIAHRTKSRALSASPGDPVRLRERLGLTCRGVALAEPAGRFATKAPGLVGDLP